MGALIARAISKKITISHTLLSGDWATATASRVTIRLRSADCGLRGLAGLRSSSALRSARAVRSGGSRRPACRVAASAVAPRTIPRTTADRRSGTRRQLGIPRRGAGARRGLRHRRDPYAIPGGTRARFGTMSAATVRARMWSHHSFKLAEFYVDTDPRTYTNLHISHVPSPSLCTHLTSVERTCAP